MTSTADLPPPPPAPSPIVPPDSLRLVVDLEPRIHLAAQQNSVPTIRAVELENLSPETLTGVEVRFRMDPEFVEPWSVTVAQLDAHGRHALATKDVNPWVSTSRLMA